MKNKKAKKGFTLVELLVVITILAVLATVSVIGYRSFTKKAQVSNDTSLVAQLNIALKANEATDGKPETPTDMLEVMEENGFNVEKLTPTTLKYNIVWNQEANEFALLNEKNECVYGTATEDYRTWKFLDQYEENTTYSVYLKGTSLSEDLVIQAGLDVGKNDGISNIVYNTTTAQKSQNVVIRTNSLDTNLTINAYVDENGKGDVIHHYGKVSESIINQCANESYHEFGKVGYVELSKGHFVAEQDSKIRAIVVSSEEAKVDTKESASVLLPYAKTEAIKTNHKGNVELKYVYDETTIDGVKAAAKLCEEGIGTQDNPFIIGQDNFNNVENLDKLLIADVASNSSIHYYKLSEDVDFSIIKHKFTQPQCYVGMDKADIDLNGKTIKNLDLPLVMYKNYLNVHNGKIEFKDNGSIGIYYMYGNTELVAKDLICSGKMSGDKGIVGPCISASAKITLENIKSYVEIDCSSGNPAAGLVGSASASFNITLKNCKVYGDITTTNSSASGMIYGTNLDFSKISVDNCYYYGTITVADGGTAYFCAPGYENDALCNGGGRINNGAN